MVGLDTHDDALGVDLIDDAFAAAEHHRSGSRAVTRSMPVPTSGASPRIKGTAWRCMLEPMSARLASSFSRNGIKLAATETSCLGEDVNVIDFLAALQDEVAGLAAVD